MMEGLDVLALLQAADSQRPVSTAPGIIAASVLDFALNSQPYIMQNPQC